MRNHFYNLPEVLQQKILLSKAKQEAQDVVQATDISMLIGFVNLGTQRQRQIAAWIAGAASTQEQHTLSSIFLP